MQLTQLTAISPRATCSLDSDTEVHEAGGQKNGPTVQVIPYQACLKLLCGAKRMRENTTVCDSKDNIKVTFTAEQPQKGHTKKSHYTLCCCKSGEAQSRS